LVTAEEEEDDEEVEGIGQVHIQKTFHVLNACLNIIHFLLLLLLPMHIISKV
jgi:hypothetical protein